MDFIILLVKFLISFRATRLVQERRNFNGGETNEECWDASAAAKMAATDAVRTDNVPESIDALSREAEQLKAKLEEERSKLSDVDRE